MSAWPWGEGGCDGVVYLHGCGFEWKMVAFVLGMAVTLCVLYSEDGQ